MKRMKWGTEEELINKIDTYFLACSETGRAPNVPGLCLVLDISTECLNYYANERYKYKHKSEEEKEAIQKEMEANRDSVAEHEALEEFLTVSPNVEVIDSYDVNSKYDKEQEEAIKRRLSAVFKRAKLRLEEYVINQVMTSKTPVGNIFMAKSQFGYREADAVAQQQQSAMPTKIIIEVLPAVAKAAQISSDSTK